MRFTNFDKTMLLKIDREVFFENYPTATPWQLSAVSTMTKAEEKKSIIFI
jgi:hypothetical protein